MSKTTEINPVGPQSLSTPETPDTGDTFTDKKLLKAAEEYADSHSGHSYVIYTDDGGVHDRTHSPCYGHLRDYDIASDGVSRPSDLPHDFPAGHPIGIAIAPRANPYASFIFTNPMSPWRQLVGKCRLTKNNGLVVTNTHFNSDVLVNALFAFKTPPLVGRLLDPTKDYDDVTLLAEYLTASTCSHGHGVLNGPNKWANGQQLSFKRLVTGTPDVLPNFNFYDRAAYRRPIIEYIWRDKIPDYIWTTTKKVANPGWGENGLYNGSKPKLYGKYIQGYAVYPEPGDKNITLASIIHLQPGMLTSAVFLKSAIPVMKEAIEKELLNA